MRVSLINTKYDRVIQASFGHLLGERGYERQENQFFLKLGRVGKLLLVQRDADHPYYRQVVIFTIQVYITSDDFWEMNYPDQVLPPLLPLNHRYVILDRHLGNFYGKQRGSQSIALDASLPEHLMIGYLRDLLLSRILPFLDRMNTIDDVMGELRRGRRTSIGNLLLLAWLGRRQEAYAELQRLIEARHQKGYRMNLVKTARRLSLL